MEDIVLLAASNSFNDLELLFDENSWKRVELVKTSFRRGESEILRWHVPSLAIWLLVLGLLTVLRRWSILRLLAVGLLAVPLLVSVRVIR